MESTYTVSEETWNFEVCVDSGVTGGFQTDLSISLTAVDGKASKLDNFMCLFWELPPHSCT